MVRKNTKTEKTKQLRDKVIKKCAYCESKTSPSYTDSAGLRRFTTGRAKIVPRLRSGICSKHQRGLAREVKRARHLALLPFTLTV